jgi:Zn-dependent peptidase ImmA (M78 family)
MTTPAELARIALRGALDIRKKTSTAITSPICIYDVAEALNVEVKFVPYTSLGGMFAKTANVILIPTLRPAGRRAFSCAHELGHWYFGHGDRIDEDTLEDGNYLNSDEERLVNSFAAHLLMPKWALISALKKRSWDALTLTSERAYHLANQFGVGYETIIRHLSTTLNILPEADAKSLLRETPKQIRKQTLGFECPNHLVLLDKEWSDVSVDLSVGDQVLVTDKVILSDAPCFTWRNHPRGFLLEARAPGIARIESSDENWAAFIRVSRKDFVGRSIYRHLEDSDVD